MKSEHEMRWRERKLLTKALIPLFLERMDTVHMCRHLYSYGIFLKGDVEIIESKVTSTNKSMELVQRVQKAGPDAFEVFYTCLLPSFLKEEVPTHLQSTLQRASFQLKKLAACGEDKFSPEEMKESFPDMN